MEEESNVFMRALIFRALIFLEKGLIFMSKTLNRTRLYVFVGVFSAIAFLLQMLGSMMGLKVGGFLEIEFSDLPALIIAFAYGPLAGVLCELLKNLLHCMMTSTGYVGELANFVINGSFCLVAGLAYKYNKSFKGAVISLILATIAMAIAGIFANLYIMLPLYMASAPFEAKMNIVLYTILPFNLVKGAVVSIITLLIYKKISPLLKGRV